MILLRNRAPALRSGPIEAADADALVGLHARLSADTIYRRYFGGPAAPLRPPTSSGSGARVDGAPASRSSRCGGGPGGRRATRRPGESSAEIAVVVDDALQHQGVGRLMLERLVDVAHEAGLTTLAADVVAGNMAMHCTCSGRLGCPGGRRATVTRSPCSSASTRDELPPNAGSGHAGTSASRGLRRRLRPEGCSARWEPLPARRVGGGPPPRSAVRRHKAQLP